MATERKTESQMLREELLVLDKKRESLEKEIKEWQEVLKSQNVGMTEPLVDDLGFPRNNIDVYQVRNARSKIICLQNDVRALMKTIEEKLYKYHAMNPPDPETPQR